VSLSFVQEGEIRKLTALLASSLAQGDSGTAASVYTADAKLLAPTADLLHGQAEIEGFWRAGVTVGVSAVEFASELLQPVGTSFVEVGRYAVLIRAARWDPTVDRGTYVVLHAQNADGSWRRAVDVFNPDEPSPARRTDRKEELR
jgi:ketosteroid isomerase-like protein